MAPTRSRGSVSRTPPPPKSGCGAAAGRRPEENSLLRASEDEPTAPPNAGPRRGPPPPVPINAPGIRLELQVRDRLPLQLMVHRLQRQPPQLRRLPALAFPFATPVQALRAHVGTAVEMGSTVPATASTAALPISITAGEGQKGSLVVSVPHNLAFPVEITLRADPRERR
eukprot:s5051_g1.t1